MDLVIAAGCGLLGLLIGSFLNVVIWRVPRGESVVRPPSACPGCGHQIGPRDNIPVVSWLLLAGRCRNCREAISPRYPLVELATSLAFAAVGFWLGPVPELVAFLYLAAISICLSLIDIDVKRLPDPIVLPSIGVALIALGLPVLAAGQPGRLFPIVGGGFALFAFYAVVWFIYPRGMGLGDVKLAAVLGQYLGFFGWGTVIVGGFLGFLVGGIAGIILMLAAGRRWGAKIPYGPWMICGAWLGILVGRPLIIWYLSLFGL